LPIHFTCTCGRRVIAPDNATGKRAKCPACGRQVVVPLADGQHGSSSTSSFETLVENHVAPPVVELSAAPSIDGTADNARVEKGTAPEVHNKKLRHRFWDGVVRLLTTDLATGLTPEEQAADDARAAQKRAQRPKIVPCRACGRDVSRTAPACPHCGESTPGLRVNCPKCRSISVAIGQKGFSVGKAAVGNLLFGPVGLVIGMKGAKNVELACAECGWRWTPDTNDLF
jgi:predicted RNA-binding Zn-ribbon protein involved in translation (DUF1610 family)